MADRSLPYQRLPDDFIGDFDALKSFDTYLAEAKRLRFEFGIGRAGQHGVSCPTCYKQLLAAEGGDQPDDDPDWCQCPAPVRPTLAEIRGAHGFPNDNVWRASKEYVT